MLWGCGAGMDVVAGGIGLKYDFAEWFLKL
jgi:hypothetical protein